MSEAGWGVFSVWESFPELSVVGSSVPEAFASEPPILGVRIPGVNPLVSLEGEAWQGE